MDFAGAPAVTRKRKTKKRAINPMHPEKLRIDRNWEGDHPDLLRRRYFAIQWILSPDRLG
jgi:hypothetical protein